MSKNTVRKKIETVKFSKLEVNKELLCWQKPSLDHCNYLDFILKIMQILQRH